MLSEMALSTIELLPPEIIEVIAQYLTVPEINACCATSERMRDLFDDNTVWKKRCNNELEEYLRNTPCKVEPHFVNPYNDSNTLRPISQWRLAFMRENHLWNNWRLGRFKQEEIVEENNSLVACYKFLTNDWGIGLFGTKIKIIDISNFPSTNVEIDVTQALSCSWQITGGNDMIVLQSLSMSSVQVYFMNIAERVCPLVHEFFFEESEKLIRDAPGGIIPKFELYKKLKPTDVTTINCQGCFANGSFKTQRIVVGTFFVGVLEGESTMHIWDVETGVKLKEEVCPLHHSAIYDMKASDSMNVILAVKQTGKIAISFLAYSLKDLTYLPFNKTLNRARNYIVYKDMVVVYNEFLHMYNFQTSDAVFEDQLFQYYPQILNNSLVFIQNGKLKRFNATTVQLEPLIDGISSFNVLTGRFLEMQRYYRYDVWEMGMKFNTLRRIKMNFNYNPWMYFNSTSTRCIMRHATGLLSLHLW